MKTKKGFTLIELVITITIITIVSMVSYAPYNYYKNKSKLKNSASKITQLLYDSRNMAVNGMI
jgi:prepilin-type N-terminal cleavage/methylation domain-containing protein